MSNEFENLRVLCVCQYGHSRSVALARELHHRNVAAVACGVGTAGSALDYLCDWATHICVLDDSLANMIGTRHHDRIVSMHVGPDRWVNPYHPELQAILRDLVEARMSRIIEGSRR